LDSAVRSQYKRSVINSPPRARECRLRDDVHRVIRALLFTAEQPQTMREEKQPKQGNRKQFREKSINRKVPGNGKSVFFK